MAAGVSSCETAWASQHTTAWMSAAPTGLTATTIVSCSQGGPGCSSLFGTFYLNGPFQLQTDMTLRQNPGRWNRQYGMLFVDQPIGTGFSVPGEFMQQQKQQQKWHTPLEGVTLRSCKLLLPAASQQSSAEAAERGCTEIAATLARKQQGHMTGCKQTAY